MTQDEGADPLQEMRIVRWQEHHDNILHSDRAAVDIGIFVLKVVMTINAGALIALLAAMTALNGAPGAVQFFVGLMLAVLTAFLAYIYQHLVTAAYLNDFFAEFSSSEEPPP